MWERPSQFGSRAGAQAAPQESLGRALPAFRCPRSRRGSRYPLLVVIPKDNAIPKPPFPGIFTRKLSDLALGDDLEMSRRIPRNFEIRKIPRKNAEKRKFWNNVVFWNYDK